MTSWFSCLYFLNVGASGLAFHVGDGIQGFVLARQACILPTELQREPQEMNVGLKLPESRPSNQVVGEWVPGWTSSPALEAPRGQGPSQIAKGKERN